MAALFPNPNNALRPGEFGRVRVKFDVASGALLVPQRAVNELQGSYQVFVVGKDDKASVQPVKMGERMGPMWEVLEGLKPGDKVIVQGIQKVRPGSSVTVKDWTPPAEQIASTTSGEH